MSEFGLTPSSKAEMLYLPSNTRSEKLLKRCGFVVEGLAKNYLQINGRWQDHVLSSLTNPVWKET